ncbi:uncharacterized protein LOC127733562 [Mytilus californianus]|uniref:uncharacterized protein LOC127733562 n=1 Tax=Mytilus californianus TaxID=6549 RepID=UPI0022483F23|nr:uncharacterized protein LOC127733562 [Mytilus californianus]
MDKLNANLDRGAEKGIQGVQKRIFRIMGPLSQLWEMSDSIREHSKENPTVDNVDIAHMCQLVEKTVCCVGQASLAVDRHRRVNTLLKMTEDYKKAKELLDKNEDVISQSGNCLFGEGFKKVLKKSSKTWEEASKIAFSIKKGRKKKGGFKKKRRGGYQHMNYNYNHESSHASHGTKHRHANPRRERESPFRDGPSARGRGAGGRGMARGHGSTYRGRGYRRSVSLRDKSKCNEKQSRFISLTFNNQDKCTKSNPGQKLSNFPNSVQPSHSRKVKMVFKKLAKNNRRSLYSPNSSRLQTRVQYPTITKATSSISDVQQRTKRFSKSGNSEIARKRSNTICSPRTDPIFKLHVPGSKKGRGKPSSDKLEKIKRLHNIRTLQNGRFIHGTGPAKKGGMDVQNRSERRIFDHKHLRGTQKISKISLGRQNLPIYMPSIR